MATRLYLLRHGETDWNAAGRLQGRAESSLSDRGRAQASAAGRALASLDIAAAYASSSERTAHTARLVLAERAAVPELTLRDQLREIALGPWEGLLRDEVAARWPADYEDFCHCPDRFALDGAESLATVQRRGLRALAAIAAAHPDQSVLVVSHGALIKACLLRWWGRSLAELWAPPVIDNAALIEAVAGADGAAQVLRVGAAPALAAAPSAIDQAPPAP